MAPFGPLRHSKLDSSLFPLYVGGRYCRSIDFDIYRYPQSAGFRTAPRPSHIFEASHEVALVACLQAPRRQQPQTHQPPPTDTTAATAATTTRRDDRPHNDMGTLRQKTHTQSHGRPPTGRPRRIEPDDYLGRHALVPLVHSNGPQPPAAAT